jgi:mannose-6-phosphate isomerase-like protein (cupin superfamily)
LNVPQQFVEQISHEGTLLAVVLRHQFREPGTHFFTPDDLSQQLGFLNLPEGQVIEPHTHAEAPRTVVRTQEALVILRGRLRVDLYSKDCSYLESRILEAHDTVLLVAGGHGFKVLDAVEMLEIKLGPYLGQAERVRFAAVAAGEIKVRGAAT